MQTTVGVSLYRPYKPIYTRRPQRNVTGLANGVFKGFVFKFKINTTYELNF